MEPLPCDRRQRVATPVEEVGVGAAVGAADATAELVELGKAERVGPHDDDRVRVRDVEPRLDDRGADEDVEAAFGEVEHHPLEHAFRHLAVTDGDFRLRHEAANARRSGLDVLDPVVDVEDLPATVDLAVDRVAHQAVVVLRDPRLDGQPRLGRGLDHRQVANAHERQVERARDGRRREREHVDLRPAGA